MKQLENQNLFFILTVEKERVLVVGSKMNRRWSPSPSVLLCPGTPPRRGDKGGVIRVVTNVDLEVSN